jgi:hypothetical protein
MASREHRKISITVALVVSGSSVLAMAGTAVAEPNSSATDAGPTALIPPVSLPEPAPTTDPIPAPEVAPVTPVESPVALIPAASMPTAVGTAASSSPSPMPTTFAISGPAVVVTSTVSLAMALPEPAAVTTSLRKAVRLPA